MNPLQSNSWAEILELPLHIFILILIFLGAIIFLFRKHTKWLILKLGPLSLTMGVNWKELLRKEPSNLESKLKLRSELKPDRSALPIDIRPDQIVRIDYLDTPDKDMGTYYRRFSTAYRDENGNWTVGIALFKRQQAGKDDPYPPRPKAPN